MESTTATPTAPATAESLAERVSSVGRNLAERMGRLLESLPTRASGPAELARALAVDKVLASRTLKAMGLRDPVAVLYHSPGPEPLRRVLRGATRRGAAAGLVAQAEQALVDFENLIRQEAGDRSALDAMLSAWLPEARAEFELRRKQAAYRATSQLRGSTADVNMSTALLHPSADGEHLDIVWLFGLLGLQRLRPGAPVRFATRRFAAGQPPRHPQTLDGVPVDGLDGLRLDEFCSQPPARIDVQRVGEVVRYCLADDGFGPRSVHDLVFAEHNPAELPRYLPPGQARKRHVFAEITVPVRVIVFDVLVHEHVFAGSDPALHIYDTSFEGVADVNDPSRDADRLDLCESVQPLGRGIEKFRTADVPRYTELLSLVCDKLRWQRSGFRGYRCRIDYPVYGSQIVLAFAPEIRPT